MAKFGYIELKARKTGGSRRKFGDKKMNVITLHKPHPGNVVKEYTIKQVIVHLKEKEHVKDE